MAILCIDPNRSDKVMRTSPRLSKAYQMQETKFEELRTVRSLQKVNKELESQMKVLEGEIGRLQNESRHEKIRSRVLKNTVKDFEKTSK